MDKYERLLETTLRLVLTKGYTNLSMKSLSKEAGVAIGTIYLRFTSKEQLLLALFETISQRVHTTVLKGHLAGGDFKTDFWRMTDSLLEFYTRRPDCFSFLQQYNSSPLLAEQVRRQRPEMLLPLYTIIAEAKERQLVKDLPEILLLALVAGPINEFMIAALQGHLDAHDLTLRHQLQTACWETIAR